MYNFWKAGPLKFGRAKKRPKFNAIFDNFDFDREYLQNYSRYPKSERNVIDSDSFRVPGKSPVNFGPQTKKNYWLTKKNQNQDLYSAICSRGFRGAKYIEPPKWIFGGEYISALIGGRCCPFKFLYALEIDQALIAHT